MIDSNLKVAESDFKKILLNDKEIVYTDNIHLKKELKKINSYIKTNFQVKPANRNNIIEILKTNLENIHNNKLGLIRGDIENFFGSIQQDLLLNNISNIDNNDKLKNNVRNILQTYYSFSNTNIGLPRGIAISNYLAEIFLNDIDTKIRNMSNILLYLRYVDDFIVISTQDNINELFTKIKLIFNNKNLKLHELNSSKTKIISFNNNQVDFDFLGYKFIIFNNNLKSIGLSDFNKKKYTDRIKLSFENYNSTSKYNEKKARQLLKLRLKYLTRCNIINKEITGQSYNHKYLNNKQDILYLNNVLKAEIQNIQPYSKLTININSLKKSLKIFNCNECFLENRKIYYINSKFHKKIIRLWNSFKKN